MTCLALSLLASAAFGQAPAKAGQAGAAVRRGPEPQTPPPRVLKKVTTIPFPLSAPTVVSGSPHTDREGNIYLIHSSFKLHAGPVPNVPPNPEYLPITRLSPDSQGATEYPPQTTIDGHRTFWRVDFNVDRSGSLYALYQVQVSSPAGKKQPWESVILKFDDDGSVKSTIKLDSPPSGALLPYHFAVFDDGNFLVTGIVNQPWPGIRQRGETPPEEGPFTGIFDSRGRFLQQLTLPGDVSPSSSAPASVGQETPPGGTGTANEPNSSKSGSRKGPPETPAGPRWAYALNFSLINPGPENTVYLLRASSPPVLYTLSSDGQVLHRAGVVPSSKFATAKSMSLAGRSNLLIDFFGTTVDKEGNTHGVHTYALVDPATGRVLATYELPKGVYQFFAGTDSDNGFEFVGSSEDGKLEVVKYSGN